MAPERCGKVNDVAGDCRLVACADGGRPCGDFFKQVVLARPPLRPVVSGRITEPQDGENAVLATRGAEVLLPELCFDWIDKPRLGGIAAGGFQLDGDRQRVFPWSRQLNPEVTPVGADELLFNCGDPQACQA